MKIALVTGGRKYSNMLRVYEALRYHTPDAVVHGAATGADSLARRWADENDIPHVPFPARWDVDGKLRAGVIRNTRMLKYILERISLGDECILIKFKGGSGTEDMLKKVRSKRKIRIFEID